MRRVIRGVLCVAVLFLAACTPGSGGGKGDAPGQGPTASVSGTVTHDGTPLQGVTVTAYLTNNNVVAQTAVTDSNGNYVFNGLPAGSDVPDDFNIWAVGSGLAFVPQSGPGGTNTRADHTDMFQHNGVNDISIYFSIIDYVVTSTSNLTNANFSAYDGTDLLVSLARTGESTSYATGDDASVDAGVVWPATRFIDNGDGTITDQLTGLMWLKQANCFAATVWATALTDANQLVSGQCGLSDGSTAGQWRLPNLVELESLVDISQSSPAVSAGNPMTGLATGSIYWTSTSYFGGETGSPDAWAINLGDGSYVNDGTQNVKTTSSNGVLAVRGTGSGIARLQSTGQYVVFAAGDDGSVHAGVPLTSSRWIDNGNGTVTDSVTGLIWLKQANCIQNTWANAVAAVNALASGQCGLTDGSTAGTWRMPNRNEMESMADRAQNNQAAYFDQTYMNMDGTVYQPALFTSFVENQYYWTSSTDAANTAQAWTVFSCDYGVYGNLKTSTGYTLAVKGS